MAFRPRYKKALKPAVRQPFSGSTSYVALKDRQEETQNGTIKKPLLNAVDESKDKPKTLPPPGAGLDSGVGNVNALGFDKSSRTEVSKGGDKWDGWAGRYVPGQRDMLFNNPDIIVRDWLSQGKYKDNPQMAGDLSRYANIVFGGGDRPGLYELMTAGSLNPKATGDDDMINYLVRLMGEQSKVGGKSPSIQTMLNLLYEGLNDPDSIMGSMLTGGTSGTTGEPANSQAAINAVLSYIPLLGEFSGNQRYADAMYRQAANVAQDYQDRAVKGKNTQGFADFFQQNYLR
jgi:hypothetical protein